MKKQLKIVHGSCWNKLPLHCSCQIFRFQEDRQPEDEENYIILLVREARASHLCTPELANTSKSAFEQKFDLLIDFFCFLYTQFSRKGS